jgi:hypothetical protein
MNMKSRPFCFFAIAATCSLLSSRMQASLILFVNSADEGSLRTYLQPNQPGQVVDYYIGNDSPSPVANIVGLNFVLQVGDGSSGPQITDVKLYADNSIFAPYFANSQNQGSLPRKAFWGIDTGLTTVVVPASGLASTLFAQVTFDTTSLGPGSGTWALNFNNSQYVLADWSTKSIDRNVMGQLTVVPEPASSSVVILAAFTAWILKDVRRKYLYQKCLRDSQFYSGEASC